MKKILIITLLLILPFSLTSCKNISPQISNSTSTYNSIQEAAYYTQESVVSITATTRTFEYAIQGVGSGTIIALDNNYDFSYILTCFHVIAKSSKDGEISDPNEVGIANTIKVTMYDGNEYDAKFVGGSYYQDIAIIAIKTKQYKPVSIRKKDNPVSVGTEVFTIGSPISLSFSYSQGIISSTQSINDSYTLSGQTTYYNFFNLDFSVNPGNSGGGLFDANGNIIGMINQKQYSTSGGVYGAGIAIKYYNDDLTFNGKTYKTYDLSTLISNVFSTSTYSLGSWKYQSFISY